MTETGRKIIRMPAVFLHSERPLLSLKAMHLQGGIKKKGKKAGRELRGLFKNQ